MHNFQYFDSLLISLVTRISCWAQMKIWLIVYLVVHAVSVVVSLLEHASVEAPKQNTPPTHQAVEVVFYL